MRGHSSCTFKQRCCLSILSLNEVHSSKIQKFKNYTIRTPYFDGTKYGIVNFLMGQRIDGCTSLRNDFKGKYIDGQHLIRPRVFDKILTCIKLAQFKL